MNFIWIDWLVLAVMVLGVNLAAILCGKYVKGVADFLVAGRNVGRYVAMNSDSMQYFGAVTMVGIWQMVYSSGFAGQWWFVLSSPIIGVIVALTGWGIIRFRQTRAMTIGQFLEMRYDKKTRIFFGVISYIGGILNMAISPVIGATFFVYFCGFPPEMPLLGFEVPTTLPLMILLIGISIFICLSGGQVSLVITNFIQSVFFNIMLVAVVLFVYQMMNWEHFAEAYRAAEDTDSLVHPFRIDPENDFSIAFFMFSLFWLCYNVVSWAPDMMQVASVKDAQEARMMRVFSYMKYFFMLGLGFVVLPLAAFVLMNHPDFGEQAAQVHQTLGQIGNEQLRDQMITPVAIVHIIPHGFLGAFAGIILFAFISSHGTYIMAWGSVLIQDVVIPLHGKSLEPKTHMNLIRLSILVVAIFIIAFSMLFRQVDNIWMYMYIGGAVFSSSAGVVILGGLYLRFPTHVAALISMGTGATLALSGFVYRALHPEWFDGREIVQCIVLVCLILYFGISLLFYFFAKGSGADLDKILNRNKDKESGSDNRSRLGWLADLSLGDRRLILLVIGFFTVLLLSYGAVSLYNMKYDVPTESWLSFWYYYFHVMFVLGTLFLTWITIGGIRDLVRLFRSLKAESVDIHDDGTVQSPE